MPKDDELPPVSKWTGLEDKQLLRVITHWVRNPGLRANETWNAVQLHPDTALAPRVFDLLGKLRQDKANTKDVGMWTAWIKIARTALSSRPHLTAPRSNPPTDNAVVAPEFSWG